MNVVFAALRESVVGTSQTCALTSGFGALQKSSASRKCGIEEMTNV
jgi:hypothetical protein